MQDTNQREMSLSEIISEIISYKSDIAYLKKCVTMGNIYTNRGYIASDINGIRITDNTNWIRLVKISKTFMSRYFNYVSTERRNNTDVEQSFLVMFNNKYRSSNGDMFYIGSNVDFNLKVGGYHYNASDIYNSYIVDSNGRTIDEKIRKFGFYIYKLLFIGDKNFLVGFIDKFGVLYLDQVILDKLRQTDYDKFKEVIVKLISVFANVNILFFRSNIMGIEGELIDRIGKFLIAELNKSSQECTIIEPKHIDIFNDSNEVNILLSKIKEIIITQVEKYLRDTKWGINDQYSYKQLLDSYMSHKYQSLQSDIDKAFSNGLLYGNKFELSGWSVSDQKFDGDIAWEKEVHIIPSKVNYRSNIYNIDPNWKENPFHIDKIYITINGKMFCDGKHPNVSGGSVCMGDIAGKIVLSDVRKLGENLNRCEALLTLINFDSAYDNSMREEVLDHSTIDASSNFEIDKEYIGDNETLTDVSFEDDDDSEKKIDEDNETNVEIIND